MPTYEYQCTACGHHLEAFQKISDNPLVDCPNCKQQALKKLLSPSNFQLKGTGWYVTDFRDKGKPKPAEKTDGDKTGGASSSDQSSASDTGTTGTSTTNPSSTKTES